MTLLRHSTTGLVRRYAHLSLTHLKTAVETVASFGKPFPVRPEMPQVNGEEAPISNGTVTKTVTRETVKEVSFIEVAEKIGAGDGI